MMKILTTTAILFVATLTSGTVYSSDDDSKMVMTSLIVASSCNREGTVNTAKDPLNIRDKPSQNAKVVAKAPKGASVCILSIHDDNWYKVKYKNTTGYAASAFIKG